MNARLRAGWIIRICFLTVAAFITMNTTYGANKNSQERIIKIVAQRFVYIPNQITLKKGEPVRLEFTSLDFIHGFNVPDLNIRADLPPGKITTIHLMPDKAGIYEFICDNFCGAGHEDMGGKIVVKD